MELLVFVINDTRELEDIMIEFTNVGISGSTIIDSVGMANVLSTCEEASMFSSLQLLLIFISSIKLIFTPQLKISLNFFSLSPFTKEL